MPDISRGNSSSKLEEVSCTHCQSRGPCQEVKNYNRLEEQRVSSSNLEEVSCTHCQGKGPSQGVKNYNRLDEQKAPGKPPKVIFTPIPQRPRLNDVIIGGGASMSRRGHLDGAKLHFDADRQKEIEKQLPQGYHLGEEPSGPCAYEISQFLQCAASSNSLNDCDLTQEELQECKKKNKL